MSKKAALVIGNSAYTEAKPLANPVNDAVDITSRLKAGGFEVTTLTDADYKTMHKALKTFTKAISPGDVALIFFAGHGVQVDGVNYLTGTDTPVDDEVDAKHGSLSLDEVLERMEKAGAMTNIVILDACRDNPWDRKWRGKPRGLAPVYAPKGTLIGFATSPGQLASDGKGRNGAYTAALLQHIDTADIGIEDMFKRVRNSLSAATGQKQTSWEHTSLSGEFFFNLSVAARIDDYGATAIKDRTFVLDESRLSHRTIKGLKSSNWYTQNPALDLLDVAKIAKTGDDNLFVLGRNILQAANGSANSAVEWIKRFPARTSALSPAKRKAVLDGILFEIFFNADGERRERIKGNMFAEVFALQQYPDLKPSFDFIASVLATDGVEYVALPGKGINVSVDVSLAKGREVTGVFVGGQDFLSDEEDGFAEIGGGRIYQGMSREDFEDAVSRDLVVPPDRLSIQYDPPLNKGEGVRAPWSFKLKRP